MIWAGTFFDRLHLSTNQGANWTPLQDAAGNHLLLDGNGHRNAGALVGGDEMTSIESLLVG